MSSQNFNPLLLMSISSIPFMIRDICTPTKLHWIFSLWYIWKEKKRDKMFSAIILHINIWIHVSLCQTYSYFYRMQNDGYLKNEVEKQIFTFEINTYHSVSQLNMSFNLRVNCIFMCLSRHLEFKTLRNWF